MKTDNTRTKGIIYLNDSKISQIQDIISNVPGIKTIIGNLLRDRAIPLDEVKLVYKGDMFLFKIEDMTGSEDDIVFHISFISNKVYLGKSTVTFSLDGNKYIPKLTDQDVSRNVLDISLMMKVIDDTSVLYSYNLLTIFALWKLGDICFIRKDESGLNHVIIKTQKNATKKQKENLYRMINVSIKKNKSSYIKGNGTKHTHEYDRRGHYRHLKSGKVVYVKQTTCCKGRGKKIIHDYVGSEYIKV